MSTIHVKQTTSLTPEQFIARLTDFGPGRSKLLPNSADEYLKLRMVRTSPAWSHAATTATSGLAPAFGTEDLPLRLRHSASQSLAEGR